MSLSVQLQLVADLEWKLLAFARRIAEKLRIALDREGVTSPQFSSDGAMELLNRSASLGLQRTHNSKLTLHQFARARPRPPTIPADLPGTSTRSSCNTAEVPLSTNIALVSTNPFPSPLYLHTSTVYFNDTGFGTEPRPCEQRKK
jgi:hypothetical protein